MGRVKDAKLQVQLIGLKNIRIDNELQSRCHVHKEYVREFSEAILRGDAFPAVEVFWDGKTYWLADGFHRAEAHEKAGIANIRCNIHYGTREDAAVYSAGANQKFSIPRSREDREKAAFMLFSVGDWLTQSTVVVAKHLGIGPLYVRNYRLAFCAKNGIKPPEVLINSEGREYYPQRLIDDLKGPTVGVMRRRKGQRTVKIGQKRHVLPEDLDQAEAMIARLVSQERAERATKSAILETSNALQQKLTSLLIDSWPCNNLNAPGLGMALAIENAVVIAFDSSKHADCCGAVGRVLLNKQKHMPKGRAIVLCYDLPPSNIVAIASRLGVEFMSPEQLRNSRRSVPATRKGDRREES